MGGNNIEIELHKIFQDLSLINLYVQLANKKGKLSVEIVYDEACLEVLLTYSLLFRIPTPLF